MSNQNFIIMSTFYDFAQRYFAEKLGVPVEQVEEIYEIVQENFRIDVQSSKYSSPDEPERFTGNLLCKDEDECWVSLCGFKNKDGQSKFITHEEAFEVAASQVNDIVLSRRGDYFIPVIFSLPPKALLLFDTQQERSTFETLSKKNKPLNGSCCSYKLLM